MAAGEDEAQPIVLDLVGLGLFRGERLELFGLDVGEAAFAPQGVDRLEAPGGDEPGARIGGHALARPLLERRAKRFGHRFFGELKVAEQAHQRGEHAARFRPVDGFDVGARHARR